MGRIGVLLALMTFAGGLPAEQAQRKEVLIRGSSRERNGRVSRLTVETMELGTIRGFAVSSRARVRLLFPKSGSRQALRPVTLKRFGDLLAGKDRKPPQPFPLTSPFTLTLRDGIVTAIDQKPSR